MKRQSDYMFGIAITIEIEVGVAIGAALDNIAI
jgi:hypothetical protein